MPPISYTGLKVVYEQELQEKMEKIRGMQGEQTHATFGAFLAHFAVRSGRHSEPCPDELTLQAYHPASCKS